MDWSCEARLGRDILAGMVSIGMLRYVQERRGAEWQARCCGPTQGVAARDMAGWLRLGALRNVQVSCGTSSFGNVHVWQAGFVVLSA